MKTLTTVLIAGLLALAAGCGDNLSIDGPNAERGGEVVIIPHPGESLSALEEIGELGFTDAILFEDGGYISAFGDLSLIDELAAMPAIDAAGSPEDIAPLLPDLPVDGRPSSAEDAAPLLPDLPVDGQPNSPPFLDGFQLDGPSINAAANAPAPSEDGRNALDLPATRG